MKRIILVFAWIFIVPILLLIAFSTLDHLDAFSNVDILYGIDYVPAMWISLLLLMPVALFFFSGRRAIAIIITFIAFAYVAAFGDFSLSFLVPNKKPAAGASKKISVMALNVQYYSNGLKKVFSEVRSLNPDVVLLSENTLSDSLFKIAEHIISPMQFYMGHSNSTAILSKYPVLEFKEINLPSHEASLSGSNDIQDQQSHPYRSFTHAILDVEGIRLHVLSIRLIAGRPKNHTLEENIRWGRYLLNTQMDEVNAFIKYVKSLDGPVIFGGDLNAPPLSKPTRKIHALATDAYMIHHFWGDYTFRTEAPTMRLDYLFCMNNAVPINAYRPPLVVSDHFPVVAEFLLPATSSTVSNLGRITYR
jgi:endonuclease/exonuclease/phosphatase (EEP) superfamily protein YafD